MDAILAAVQEFLPREIVSFIGVYLTYVGRNPSVKLLLFGLFFSLYFPMRATNTLMRSVRIAYHLGPPRGALPQLVKTLLYTAVLIATIALTLTLMSVGDRLLLYAVDSFGLPRLGEPEDVAAIDPAGLLTHYRKILRESRIEIFYVGSAPAEAVAEYLSPLVSRLGGREGLLPPQTPFHPCPGQDVTETMEVSQGKLCMGFVTPIVNRDAEFPAMQVFNTVFGAGMTSKLFLNVREAMSLCYSIGSSYYGAKGILTVWAGIDFDKEQLTRDEILRQLDACRRGEITGEELTAGKEALLSSLRATSDSPGAIEGYYATACLSSLNMTPERYMEAVEKVSLADVVAAAQTVTLHSTYFLKGESQ